VALQGASTLRVAIGVAGAWEGVPATSLTPRLGAGVRTLGATRRQG